MRPFCYVSITAEGSATTRTATAITKSALLKISRFCIIADDTPSRNLIVEGQPEERYRCLGILHDPFDKIAVRGTFAEELPLD